MIQPRVLLLDEPLSNLDAKLRVEMRLELLKLQANLGLTTIYVTHDQEEALAMSTRVAVIYQGHVAQEGAPREIYEHPANDFVAGFVGQTNLFTGKFISVDCNRTTVELADGIITAVSIVTPYHSALPGDTVLVGVRPEALRVTERNTDQDGSTRFHGTIIASAYQGACVEYEIAALGKILKARTTEPKGKRLFQRGENVAVAFADQDVTFIPARADA